MIIDKRLNYKQGVYGLFIANHIYVGSSINLGSRLRSHRNYLLHKKHDNQYLQRAVNKYGLNMLTYKILEFCPGISIMDLRKRELYYINLYHADLNLKKDPTTEQNCLTTSRAVYQYDQYGHLVQKWMSISEAARHFKVNVSNIVCCCSKPKRQQWCKGFLWSYKYPYPFKLPQLIYLFNLDGKFAGEYTSTSQIAEKVFSDVDRKTVLSQLKKKIDSGIPYKEYYLSTSKTFSITKDMIKRHPAKTAIDDYLDTNPTIYIYNKQSELIGISKFNDLKHSHTIRIRIKNGTSYKYSLVKREPGTFQSPTRRFKCKVQDRFTGEIFIYDTAAEAAVVLFNDKKQLGNIRKHVKSHTPFRGYYFWDL